MNLQYLPSTCIHHIHTVHIIWSERKGYQTFAGGTSDQVGVRAFIPLKFCWSRFQAFRLSGERRKRRATATKGRMRVRVVILVII